MENTGISSYCKRAAQYVGAFFKWAFLAVFVGVICGGVGTVFHETVDFVTHTRTERPYLVWLLPLAGLVIVLLYRLCKVSFHTGTNLVFESVTTGKHIPILLAPLIYVGTALSHLCGASVGREGAALQLGGSIGHNVGELFRLDAEDVKVLAMSGMAACFSALFGAPLTAAIFVLEVISVGSWHYNAFLPCVGSSYAAFVTATLLGVKPMTFILANEIPELTPFNAVRVLGLAAICAAVSILFCVCIHFVGNLASRYLKNEYVRIAVGGVVMAVLTAVFGLYDYNGAGTDVIQRAMDGQASPLAFLLKILLTALCVGVGFRGGEIVPTMFIGATLGCVAAPILGIDAGFGAALGLVCLFCAVVNCPVASIFLAVELFGTINLPLFVIAIAVSFVLSGYFGLYSSQRIVFSKIKQAEINQNTQ